MEGAYGLAITVTMLMTTALLTAWLRQHNIPGWATWSFFVLFACIETAFLCANLFKFMHGGWYTMLIAGALTAVVFIWYNAGNIRRRYFQYADIRKELGLIAGISQDHEIPKTASNMVYISISPDPNLIETKILYSIINKQPKRADHYWFIRVAYTDQPDTLEYTVDELIPGCVFSIGLRLGYRVNPHVNVYLRQVIETLVKEKRVDIISGYPSLRKHHIPGDFHFTIIHRIFSPDSQCRPFERFVMSLYERIRHIGLDHDKALGLDTALTTIEHVPLILNSGGDRRRITRIHS